MQSIHHIRPDAAPRMSPEGPRNGLQFGMIGLAAQIADCLEKGFFRASARIEPKLRAAGGEVIELVEYVIRWAQEGAVPFLRQRLPVQVIGGGGTFLRGCGSGAVLVNNDAAQAR